MDLILFLRKLAALGPKAKLAFDCLSRIFAVIEPLAKDGLTVSELFTLVFDPFLRSEVARLIEILSEKTGDAPKVFGNEAAMLGERAALENQIVDVCEVNDAVVFGKLDGSRIRAIIKFIEDHPEILNIIISLL